MNRPLEILSKLESAGIEPKQARAILECLELAAAESQRRAHPPAPRSAFQNFSFSAFSSASALSTSLRPEASTLSSDLRTEMSLCASDLRTALIGLKTSLIGWMFFFAVTQCLATALLIKFHR